MPKNVLPFPVQIQQGLPQLIDDPSVTEQFADNLAGLQVVNGNISLTFATMRADHTKIPAPNHRRVTARLVMPLSVAMELQNILNQVMPDLEAKGLIKRGPPMPTGPMQ